MTQSNCLAVSGSVSCGTCAALVQAETSDTLSSSWLAYQRMLASAKQALTLI
jgi:hypothetical protein